MVFKKADLIGARLPILSTDGSQVSMTFILKPLTAQKAVSENLI